MRSTCRHCFGSCMLIKTPCVECQGKGKTVQRKRVIVPVPAGRTDCFLDAKNVAYYDKELIFFKLGG